MGRTLRWVVVAVGYAGASASAVSPAQFAPPPTPQPSQTAAGSNTSSMMANPMMNPAFNPYLNPLAGANQDPRMARDAAVLYLLQRQAQGGIGSGQLANGRPAPKAATTNRAPAQMPPAVMVPGANASRYFNSGQGAANGMNEYFSRKSRVMTSTRR